METNQPIAEMAGAFPPELLADSSLWQKLYIPAPWRDKEMLGQAVLNALKYSDHPYRKWMSSFFDRPKPKGRVKLHRAAIEGDANAYPRTNRTGKSYDIADSHGKTPLMLAAANGQFDVIERLLSLGADVNLGNHDGQSPLHHAAANGQSDSVVELIRAGAQVNQLDEIGRTPLHIAARNGFEECLQVLLQAGALADAHDWEFSSTPLHLAARGNHDDAARILIQHGAKINAKNEGGRTPLHIASAYGHPEIMAPLLDAGAMINYFDGIEESPLSSAVFFQHLECMRLLIDRSANVNLAGYRGYTPLHVAGYTNREFAAQMLIEAGANLETADNEGLTPLDLAFVNQRCYPLFKGHNSEVIDKLLEAGASADPMRIPVQDRHTLWSQLTPPHMVDASGYLITRTIPSIPPDLAAELEAARPHDIPERPYIVSGYPSDNLKFDAILKGLNGLLARLLEIGIAQSADAKREVLGKAVFLSNSEAIRVFADSGADLDYPASMLSDGDWYQRYSHYAPVLDEAIGYGKTEIVRLLLELGATPPLPYDNYREFGDKVSQAMGEGKAGLERLLHDLGTALPDSPDERAQFLDMQRDLFLSISHPIFRCHSSRVDEIVHEFAESGIEIVSAKSLTLIKKEKRRLGER